MITTVSLESGVFPVKVFFERRQSARAAVGTKQLILRCPLYLSKPQKAQTWSWFMDWLRKVEAEQPDAFNHLKLKEYRSGSSLRVGKRTYTIIIEEANRKTVGGRLEKDRLQVFLPKGTDPRQASKAIKTVLSRLVARDFLPEIKQRVYELNEQHFGKKIADVRLKYNTSNWGSCSSNQIINLSTRLLFAPQRVIDYVIVHELAHLIEANHSKKYWKLVEERMPEYREYEQWLKKNGRMYDF
ncbi:MAG TPA: SprT family zinc-dependent metalloprotease [Saprospiraceae bacterium]|nr:SprT family zinc-dependent metalloprotease [Saprospiraceae bacterium]